MKKLSWDYLLPVLIWIMIFGKNLSNLAFIDFIPSTFFDSMKFLSLSDYTLVLSPIDILKLILSFVNLLPFLFTISILISMLASYFFIKKLFQEKPLLFSVLFSLIFFFNPFVYSRIMSGQLSVLLSYLFFPFLIYYMDLFLKNPCKKSMIIFSIAFTFSSLFSVHFFAINLIIFLAAFFSFYFKEKKSLKPYLFYSFIFIILLVLLNSFWLQSLFSNPIYSAINQNHENFFSPKMSENISAVAKTIGMYGFWRESAYITAYKSLPLFVWYPMLAILILLFILGFYLAKDNLSRFFFILFWIGLLLGTGISHPYTKPFFDFLFNYLPLFNGLRDSHKLVSLICLAYAYFIPVSIISLINKAKSNKLVSAIILSLFLIFLFSFTLPLINIGKQAHPISYPESYFQANDFLMQKQGKIIYLPWQTYLSYSWSLDSSSDGRIPVPINHIITSEVLTGVDEYGAENSLTLEITKCIKDESVQCLEKNNVQFIINDKCAIFPDKYKWVSESGIKIVFSGNCLDIYETNPKEFNKPSVPLRFIIGVLISLMALCWIIKNIVIPKITSTRLMML